jgi:chromosome segregation ATPase
MVADWRRAVEGAATTLVDSFEKTCGEQISGQEKEWRPKIDQVRAMLSQAFEAIADHDQKVEEYTRAKWSELKDAQLKATEDAAHTLADELSSLSQAAENYEGELEAAAEMVSEQQQHAAEAATQLANGLVQVRGQWATFGIIS